MKLLVHYEVHGFGRATAEFYDDPDPWVDDGGRGRIIKKKLTEKHGGKCITIINMWFEGA